MPNGTFDLIRYLTSDGSHAQATGSFSGRPGDYLSFSITNKDGFVRNGLDLDYLEFDSHTYFASCQSSQDGTAYPFTWRIRRLSNPGGPVIDTGKLLLLDWEGSHMTVEVSYSGGASVNFLTMIVPDAKNLDSFD